MIRAFLALAALLSGGHGVATECANDLAALRQLAGNTGLPLRWMETGMRDGKPLVLVLREQAGVLHVRFEKAREGLWAEGAGSVCAAGGGLEMRFDAGQLRPGPAANWLLQQALRSGGRFAFTRGAAGELLVATTGWSGRFVAATAAGGSVTPARDSHPNALQLP